MAPIGKRCLYCNAGFGLISYPSNCRIYCSKECMRDDRLKEEPQLPLRSG
jgi:hypothetical protein